METYHLQQQEYSARFRSTISILAILGFNIFFSCNSGHSQSHNIQVIKDECCAKLDMPYTEFIKHEGRGKYYMVEQLLCKDNNSEFIAHISLRSHLQKLHTKDATCSGSKFDYVDDENEVKVEIQSDVRFINDVEGTVIEYESYYIQDSLVESINGKLPIGITRRSDSIKVFSSFEVAWNEKYYDLLSEVSDLVDMSFCETHFSIKPIEAYISDDKSHLYVYIFGFNENNIIEAYPKKILNAYMVKYIINKDEGYIGRLLLQQGTLDNFDWNCDGFIGF